MDQNKPIYLDYNASTPLDAEVITEMRPYLEEFYGNASSAHWYGFQAKSAVEKARSQVAKIINCNIQELVFTSGGTESNNYAILGVAKAMADKGNHIITSAIEHPAVIQVCKYLESNGFEITYLQVDEYGSVNLAELEKAVKPETILISIMHANNEIGTIQPIKEISAISNKNGIVFHTDAAQSLAKIPVDVQDLGVDLLSIAGHKLYGPQGVGALYIKDGVNIPKLMHGAGHENGRRPGTENVLEIVGLGKACEVGKRDLRKNMDHMKKMRDRLFEKIENSGVETRLNGHPTNRLPNTLSLSFKDVNAQSLIMDVSQKVAISSGSACHAEVIEISDVLKAMDIPVEWAMGTLRISVGRYTTEEEIDLAAEILIKSIEEIKDSIK